MTNTPVNPHRRWIIYIRVSTEDQAREGVSLAGQEQTCRALLASRNIHDAEVIQDPGFSGKDLRRPGAVRILDGIQKGHIAGVCAWRLDRLTRSVRDMLRLVDLCTQHAVQLLTVTDSIDTNSASGRFLLGILAQFAQYERELISERISMSIASRRSRGAFTGGRVPIGLVSSGPRGDRKLDRDPLHASVISSLWTRYRQGESLGALAEWMTSQGIPTPSGSAWARQTIQRILVNPIYVGLLIDQETLDGTRATLLSRRPTSRAFHFHAGRRIGRGTDRVWLLSGIARCANCGGAMIGVTATGSKGRTYPYYRCSQRNRGTPCKARELPAQTWEEAVIEGLTRVVADQGPLLETWALERGRTLAAQAELVTDRALLVRNRDGITSQVNRLVDALAHGNAVAAAVGDRITALAKDREVLDGRIAAIDARLAAAQVTEADLAKRCQRLRQGMESLSMQPITVQQRILSALVAEVRVGAGQPLSFTLWPSSDGTDDPCGLGPKNQPDPHGRDRADEGETTHEPGFVQVSDMVLPTRFELVSPE